MLQGKVGLTGTEGARAIFRCCHLTEAINDVVNVERKHPAKTEPPLSPYTKCRCAPVGCDASRPT